MFVYYLFQANKFFSILFVLFMSQISFSINFHFFFYFASSFRTQFIRICVATHEIVIVVLFCLFSVYLLIPESIFINGLHCERWSPMTFPSELVRRRLEVVTLVNHDYRYPLHKTTVFFVCSHFKMKRVGYISLEIKRP